MTRSGHRNKNQRQKKRALHNNLNHVTQNPYTTKSVWDKVVEKLIEEIVKYAIKFLIVSILLLLFSKYKFFSGKKELLEYVVEIFSKLK